MNTLNNAEYVSNLVSLLIEKEGSIFGCHRTKLNAKEQRALFGQFLGKGVIIIDGAHELVIHRTKIAYGADWEDTARISWKDL